jgi:hypothetical protein
MHTSRPRFSYFDARPFGIRTILPWRMTLMVIKGKKRWEMPKRGNAEARQINPGDVGIWATCAMKKEAPTVADLRDLFQGVSCVRCISIMHYSS